MFIAKYGSLDPYDEYLVKIFIIDPETLQFDKNGIYLKYLRNLMELCLIMSIFSFMIIYLIESNQLVEIEISCGSLYQMNQIKMNLRLKQHRYMITRSKIRGGILTKINQTYSSEKDTNNSLL